MYTDDVWGRSGPHAVINITEPTKAKRIVMVDEIKRAIEIAETIPFRYLIQHIGVGEEEYDQRKVEAAFTALEEINVLPGSAASRCCSKILRIEFSSAERLESFLRETHLKLGYCFDIGHAHMGEGVEDEFNIMKSRIRSTHVHDNNGKDDSHLFPLAGRWRHHRLAEEYAVCCAPATISVPLLLELREVPELQHPLEEDGAKFLRNWRTFDESGTPN